MKRALLVVLAVLCVGCGGADEPVPYKFAHRNFVFRASFVIDAIKTRDNVDLICDLFPARLGIPFCTTAGTVNVNFILQGFEGADGRRKEAVDVPFYNTMFIAPHELNLAHECLHLWDFQHVAVGSLWHQGWDTNGYNATADEYQRRASPVNIVALPPEEQ